MSEVPHVQKPKMSRREANWRVMLAGMQAQERAETDGDVQSRYGAMDMAGVELVNGLVLYPPSANATQVLRHVEAVFSMCQRSMNDLSIVLIVARPIMVWRRMRGAEVRGSDADAKSFCDWLEDETMLLGSRLTPGDLRALNTWLNEEMAALSEASGVEDEEEQTGSVPGNG